MSLVFVSSSNLLFLDELRKYLARGPGNRSFDNRKSVLWHDLRTSAMQGSANRDSSSPWLRLHLRDPMRHDIFRSYTNSFGPLGSHWVHQVVMCGGKEFPFKWWNLEGAAGDGRVHTQLLFRHPTLVLDPSSCVQGTGRAMQTGAVPLHSVCFPGLILLWWVRIACSDEPLEAQSLEVLVT